MFSSCWGELLPRKTTVYEVDEVEVEVVDEVEVEVVDEVEVDEVDGDNLWDLCCKTAQ